ncbi:MAG TPA: cation:proton antiporter [Coleofasciculaceae cyanobacterium]|jgi:CPA2 family monovalent cation:H+ antiporter-2
MSSVPDIQALEASSLIIVVLMFSIGAILAYFLQRIHLPILLAFILTGVILGPGGLNLIQPEQIHVLSQVGIIFLLFVVGLDLSVDKLKQLRYQAPLAGIFQLGITTVILTLTLGLLTGMPWQLAFLLGSILSLSSTAIVLKSLEDHREVDSVHGRLILGVLIIQDLSIIPLMALLPALTQPVQSEILGDLSITLLKALLFGTLTVAVSLRLVPVFLDRLASTNSKELFTLALVCISLGMALITSSLGLSLEAGAFVAGLSLSRSVFCRQVIADSKAFRDVFITLFFVSMGLLFNVRFLLQHPLLVLGTTALLIILKGLAAYASVRLLRFPHKTALWAGISLFQVGEFSFIMLERTLQTATQVPAWQHVLSFWSPVVVDAIIISMFLTPLVMRKFHTSTAPYFHGGPHGTGKPDGKPDFEETPNRVIIAGFGPTGRNLVTVLESTGIPFSIIEMNLRTVRKLQEKGLHCVYGDVSRLEILKEAGVQTAGVLALTFPDIRTSEAAVQHAKQLNPHIHCLVRSRYRVDVDRLYKMGVDSVIYEEFETSVSFIFHIMRHLDFPMLETDRLIGRIRDAENSLFHEPAAAEHPVFGRFSLLEGSKIEWIEVNPDSDVVGRTLNESQLRQRTGVNVIAVVNAEDKSQQAPEPDLKLNGHDVLVVVGTVDQLHALEQLLYG